MMYRLVTAGRYLSCFRDLRDATYMYIITEGKARGDYRGDYRCIPKVSKQLGYLPEVTN